MNLIKMSKLWCLLLFAPLVFITSCDEDDPVAEEDAVASFQYAIDADNFLLVQFSNFSENATSYGWDFGNGDTSAEESPAYTYAEEGEYTVVLTATNANGQSSTKSETFTLTDPNTALKRLTGAESKTWKPFREGVTAQLGPDASNPGGWWPGFSNDGKRPCLYEQTFTFHLDGTFVFDDMGTFWGENDPFGTTAVHETCFEPTAANMVNLDGADVSAWASGTHAFTYDASTGEVVLNGMGAWMGFVHTVGGADLYSNVPTASRSFNVSIVEETGYDVMTLTYDFGADGLWTSVYASYSDASLEPDIVTDFVEPPCEPLAAISPSEISHTFASNDAADWTLLQFIAESGSGLELGVDDPADASAAKVGKYVRNAEVQYQELQFKLEPANAINFENLTTISMEVYMPSTNDYSGDWTDNVFFGFGATTCPPNWWEDLHQYEQMEVAKDSWVTVSFDLSSPSTVSNTDNGATVKDRNDLDMIFIAIGGGGHGVGAEFYMRNFSIK